MEKTNEKQVIKSLIDFVKIQLTVEPASDWGRGVVYAYEHTLDAIKTFCNLNDVEIENEDDH